jgi:hypothetical protein
MRAVLPSNFDINKLTFEPVKSIQAQKDPITGAPIGTTKKQIYMKYGGDTLKIQTPIAVAPFGISKPYGDDAGEKEWIIDMDLDKINISGIEGAENLPEISILEKKILEFKNILHSIDDKCCEQISGLYEKLWPTKKPKNKESKKMFMNL